MEKSENISQAADSNIEKRETDTDDNPEVLLSDSDTTAFDILVQRYVHHLRDLGDGYTEEQATDALNDILQLLGHQIVLERAEILDRLGNLDAQQAAKCLEKNYSDIASRLMETSDDGGDLCGLPNRQDGVADQNRTNRKPLGPDFTPAFVSVAWHGRPQRRLEEPVKVLHNEAALNSVQLNSIGRWSHGGTANIFPTLPPGDATETEVVLVGGSIVRGVRIQVQNYHAALPVDGDTEQEVHLSGGAGGHCRSLTWCYPGAILERLTSRVRYVLAGTVNPIVVLHAGTNDLGLHTTDEMIDHLAALVSEVRTVCAGARLVVSAVLPRFDNPPLWRPRLDYRQDARVGWAAKVAEVVVATREFCLRKSVLFVDAGAAVSARRFHYAPDGLHLSPAGSDVLSNVLSDAVMQMLRE